MTQGKNFFALIFCAKGGVVIGMVQMSKKINGKGKKRGLKAPPKELYVQYLF